jgi:hypothetical protein
MVQGAIEVLVFLTEPKLPANFLWLSLTKSAARPAREIGYCHKRRVIVLFCDNMEQVFCNSLPLVPAQLEG